MKLQSSLFFSFLAWLLQVNIHPRHVRLRFLHWNDWVNSLPFLPPSRTFWKIYVYIYIYINTRSYFSSSWECDPTAVSHQFDRSRGARLFLWDTSISHGGGIAQVQQEKEPRSISSGSSSVHLIYGTQLEQSPAKAWSFFLARRVRRHDCLIIFIVFVSCEEGREIPH